MGCQRTVLLISSDDVGWREVRAILAAMPDVRVVGDTAEPAEARRLAAAHRPAAIIAAATLDDRPTIPLLAELHRDCCPAGKVILLAHRYEPGQLRTPEEAGIAGYLLWGDLSCATLRHALALLLAGEVILGSRAVVATFLAGLRGEGAGRLAAGITERERAVLGWLAAGLTHEEITAVEPLSLRTVERIVAELQRKLDAPNHFVLAKKATQLGLIR
jgi:DNA-binding NarL/FixJ family response regulator